MSIPLYMDLRMYLEQNIDIASLFRIYLFISGNLLLLLSLKW